MLGGARKGTSHSSVGLILPMEEMSKERGFPSGTKLTSFSSYLPAFSWSFRPTATPKKRHETGLGVLGMTNNGSS